LTASEFRTRDLNQTTYDTVSRELSEIQKTVKSLKSSIGEAEALMDSGGHLGDS
jgi:predicted translin family RNA/ssDNA-binding protein